MKTNGKRKKFVERTRGAVAAARGTYQPLSVAVAGAVYRSPFVQRERRANLVYYDTYQLATVSTLIGAQVFRSNSIFDFDFTSTGHQPLYRDQIAAMYQQYKVLKTTFHWSCSTSNTNNGLMTVLSYASSPPTNISEIVEFSRRAPKTIISAQITSGDFVVDTATGLGLHSAEFASNPLYNTAVGSNPTNVVFTQFGLFPATATDTGCSLRVTAVFDVLFMLPLDPGLS